MHLSDRTATTAQARHLQEALLERLEKGREWATPAVESALRRTLAGIDSGIDVASPRLQASLRAIAEELAGGVETVTPRLHERIARVIPDGTPPASTRKHPRKAWWVAGATVAAVVSGLAIWRAFRRPEPSVGPQHATGTENRPDQTGPNPPGPPHPVPPSRT